MRGTIGPNLCYGLDRVESTLSRPSTGRNGRLDLRFVGTLTGGPDVACPAAVAGLDWETVVYPPFGGSAFVVSVRQPSGETLEKNVPVLGDES